MINGCDPIDYSKMKKLKCSRCAYKEYCRVKLPEFNPFDKNTWNYPDRQISERESFIRQFNGGLQNYGVKSSEYIAAIRRYKEAEGMKNNE